MSNTVTEEINKSEELIAVNEDSVNTDIVASKRKYNIPQKNNRKRIMMNDVDILEVSKIKSYNYYGKEFKLKLLAKVDEIVKEDKYKKITLKNINVLLCNGKEINNFYEMKNDIQIYIAQYVSKYFNLPAGIENVVCYMSNLEGEDSKLNLFLFRNTMKYLSYKNNEIYNKMITVEVMVHNISLTLKKDDEKTCVVYANFRMCSEINLSNVIDDDDIAELCTPLD